MMFLTPGTGVLPASPGVARTCAVIVMSTAVTPGSAATAARACSRIWSFTGHAGVVNSIANDTRPSSMRTFFTNFSVTMSRLRSGSRTTFNASRTEASETELIAALDPPPSRHHPQTTNGRKGETLPFSCVFLGGGASVAGSDSPLSQFARDREFESFALVGLEHQHQPEDRRAVE